MPRHKILIIKQDTDSFELFFSKNMQTEDVDVMAMYRHTSSLLGKTVRHFAKRSRNKWFIQKWVGDWKKSIHVYDIIIVFDKGCTIELLNAIREMAPQAKLVYWLWNIPRYEIHEHKRIADYVCCFDEDYSIDNNITYVHQFHFPDVLEKYRVDKSDKSVFYIGTEKNRLTQLISFAEIMKNYNIRLDLNVFSLNKKLSYKDINIIHQFMPYEEVLNRSGESFVIFETVKEGQTGLTLRALEALYMGKKLITNNSNIVKFDLYNSSNIYVFQGNSDERLGEFLNCDSSLLPPTIMNNYSYEDWLQKIIHL